MSEPTEVLPRDDFSTRLRELHDNPGAVRADSVVNVTDPYGRLVTWNITTFRPDDGTTTAFLQRTSADGAVRIVLPPVVMSKLLGQQARITTARRRRGARAAVETKRAAGQQIGNPEALRNARRARKPRRAKKGGKR